MPEKLVVVFTPNRQSLTGLNDLIRRATRYRRESDDLRPLLIFPLPSRIETSEPARKEKWRFGDEAKGIEGYQPSFEKFFMEAYDLKNCDLSKYFDEVMIQHVPPYSYGEEIAILIERGQDALSLTRSYSKFTERLTETDAPWASLDVPGIEEIAAAKEKEKEAIEAAEWHASKAEVATRRIKKLMAITVFTLLISIMAGVGVWTGYRQRATKTELEMAQNLSDLASLYQDRGLNKEAEAAYQRSLMVQEKVLGKDHPNVAASLKNLAELYAKTGRYEEAELLLKRSLEIMEKALGPAHPEVANSLNNLASLYRDEGRYREAEPLYKRALEIYVKATGGADNSTAMVLENYSKLLRKMKRTDEAMKLEAQAMAIRKNAMKKK
jgi:tetratricopeptide (TPR) repeat protein